jgi:PAS domain S-box-containing protein
MLVLVLPATLGMSWFEVMRPHFGAILVASLAAGSWRVPLGSLSLRTVVALLVGGVTALALIVTVSIQNARENKLVIEDVLGEQTALAGIIATNVGEWLAWQQSSVATLAAQPGFDALSSAEQIGRMDGLHALYPGIGSFVLYDRTGQPVARTRSSGGPRHLRSSVFEEAREASRLPIAAGTWDRDPQRGSFVVGAPLARSNGEFGGAVLGVGDLASLATILRQSAPDEQYRVYLLDGQGRLITPPTVTVDRQVAARAIELRKGALETTPETDTVGRLVGFAPVSALGWQLVIDMPTKDGLAGIDRMHDQILRTVLTAILAAAVVGTLVGRGLRAPFRTLSQAAGHVADGAPAITLPHSRISEVAELSGSLRRIHEQLVLRQADPLHQTAGLRDSNPTLSALVRASPLAVIVIDSAGVVAAWNPAAHRLFGWSADEALGRPVSEFFEDPIVELLQSADAPRRPLETRRRTRSGELVEAAVWSASLGGAMNHSGGVLLIMADIAERKRLDEERTRLVREQTARDEAQELQRRLAFLAEASAELNVSLDLEATLEAAITMAVPELGDVCMLDLLEPEVGSRIAASSEVDASREQTLREIWKRYAPLLAAASPVAQAVHTGQSVLVPEVTADRLVGVDEAGLPAQELEVLRSLGPLSVMAVPVLARDQVLGVQSFIAFRNRREYDATDLALAEALVRRCGVAIENARLYREAQDALRARDTFLSIASHELGSPLARVKAYAEVLLMAQSRQQLDDQLLNRSLRSIDRATSRLTTITQDLFDVSRLRVGDLQLRQVRLNLGPLIREVTKHYADELDDRHHLNVRVSRSTYPVELDPDRIEQVLDNLLRNAVKYSPDGGTVFVTLRRNDGGALLEVRDQGIGLPPGAADIIFEPFGRAANAERRNLPGMGLGLYICRSIVERHSGRIWADSPGEHQGMTVSVWLPLAE